MGAFMKKALGITWILAIVLIAGSSGTWAHEERELQTGGPEKLGEVNFPVSCNAAAQKEFNRAMALFHSFPGTARRDAYGTRSAR